MQIIAIPFSTTDWLAIEGTLHEGITGHATWKTNYINDIRIRLVEYSVNYVADHWCSKGHIIYCVEGAMETELEDGQKYILREGMMYTVGDGIDAHRSSSTDGCTLFIVD
jgi:hypothetical protein